MSLPAYRLEQAERICKSAARRLLAEQLDGDAASATTTTARSDGHALDHGDDECALLIEGQTMPVARGVDADDGPAIGGE